MLHRRIQKDKTKTDYKHTREAPSSDDVLNVTKVQKNYSRKHQVGMLLNHFNVDICLFINSIRMSRL